MGLPNAVTAYAAWAASCYTQDTHVVPQAEHFVERFAMQCLYSRESTVRGSTGSSTACGCCVPCYVIYRGRGQKFILVNTDSQCLPFYILLHEYSANIYCVSITISSLVVPHALSV